MFEKIIRHLVLSYRNRKAPPFHDELEPKTRPNLMSESGKICYKRKKLSTL
ncbi:hypothetical protein LEP1GSC168_2800 [Leptospira santarosai str. HAI134]|uniref:Uncharacterized protein n=1 Tax=Leptospira santarosai serovar Shermani str. LT 821 TaxID=758847 RepID=K8XZ11_9LEPT|nr:hypothetical protein LEP1GSC071_1421 [Leptospira santarosai str. JET]EKT86559.1 hypothetical protein LSS_11775 [Leptospira santarosai serovar Shermani str. LT 821]EMO23795.1 hypothetical protein LEP1GSC168_2800 [Leptospira santarosai str. HAI134]EMO32566.1 hypothetical protein LEP1GSC175_1221 [Leptospira santarosai str. HAI821]